MTSVQKSVESSTSCAPWVRPSRDEMTALPARSCRVNSSPSRPRAAWLWCIWSARVDFPQSIVPEKKTSSATGQAPPLGAARNARSCDDDARDEHLVTGQRPVHADQLERGGRLRRRVHDGRAPGHGDDDVSDDRRDVIGHLAEPALFRPPPRGWRRRRPSRARHATGPRRHSGRSHAPGAGAAPAAPPRPARRPRRGPGGSRRPSAGRGRRRPCRGPPSRAAACPWAGSGRDARARRPARPARRPTAATPSRGGGRPCRRRPSRGRRRRVVRSAATVASTRVGERLRPHVVRSAQGRLGQSGPGEARRTDARDVDPRGRSGARTRSSRAATRAPAEGRSS